MNNDRNDMTDQFDQQDIESNKVMGVLAYIGILILIPLLAARDSKFARFHVNQGLPLAIASVILSGGNRHIFRLFSWIPLIGWAFNAAVSIAAFVVLVLVIIGIVNVVNGRAKKLPITGEINLMEV